MAARLAELGAVGAGAAAALLVFFALLAALRLPETEGVVESVLGKLRARLPGGMPPRVAPA